VPVLKRLEAYLREQKGLALPKSQFGKAINYALNQWEALLLYASDGRLEIDNNSSERTLRPCAIGRNYAGLEIMRSRYTRSPLSRLALPSRRSLAG
jgi:transposase